MSGTILNSSPIFASDFLGGWARAGIRTASHTIYMTDDITTARIITDGNNVPELWHSGTWRLVWVFLHKGIIIITIIEPALI